MTIAKKVEGNLEAVYAGGRKVIEGYPIDTYDLLDALGFDVSVIYVGLSDGEKMPDRLAEI